MAAYFAGHGWQDITIAFPANVREIETINRLAAEIRLNLLIESTQTAQILEKSLAHPVAVWIEVDAGSGRSGVPWTAGGDLHQLASLLAESRMMKLHGLLTHAGNTYAARSLASVAAIHQETVTRMQRLRNWLMEHGFLGLELSFGDTPACSMLDDWGDVDEARPGHFVFYDLTQMEIGSCTAADVGFVVACPVVALHEERREMVLYGGAVHLSKDVLLRADGAASYGAVVALCDPGPDGGWGDPLPGVWLRSLSQEHGVVQATAEGWQAIAHHRVGDLVGVLPVHSCLTADLLQEYVTLEGEQIHMGSLHRGRGPSVTWA